MTDADERHFNSLAERIAALNQQKNFQNIGAAADTPRKRAPPPPPQPSGRPSRTQTAPLLPTTGAVTHQTPPQLPQRSINGASPIKPPPLPRRDTQASNPASTSEQSTQENGRPKPPPLPSRSATFQPSPQLPPRNPSTQPNNALSARRNSASSEASLQSSVSSLSLTKTISSSTSPGSNGTSQRKLPPVYDAASLPPLPPTKRESQAQEEAAAATREQAANQQAESMASTKPNLPPRLPSRSATTTGTQPAKDLAKARKPGPITFTGFASRVSQQSQPDVHDDAPPPVPVASRPSLAQIQAVSARPPPKPQTQPSCWACRDWSGPDAVASQYPRESIPRIDPVGFLAQRLCSPFPSYTDKARSIFTWFHHNIDYDTEAFFGGRVGRQTADGTIATGRAVCAGYAETYKAIAMRAGLECVVIAGHGKGFGYTALKKGERPPPPNPDGHAWNAVRVDGGDWKLLDACWGAGHVDGATRLYKKAFHPAEFSASNDIFGRKHFPQESRYQLRDDGRVISWEEYYVGPIKGESVDFFGGSSEEGIAEPSVQPMERHISMHGGDTVRFRFSKVCEHWASEKHGRGKTPIFLLHMPGAITRGQDMVPMETDGFWYWLDVDARQLGPPGQSVFVAQLTMFDGREGQEARAVTKQEFLSKWGRVGMGWDYLMKWELV